MRCRTDGTTDGVRGVGDRVTAAAALWSEPRLPDPNALAGGRGRPVSLVDGIFWRRVPDEISDVHARLSCDGGVDRRVSDPTRLPMALGPCSC